MIANLLKKKPAKLLCYSCACDNNTKGSFTYLSIITGLLCMIAGGVAFYLKDNNISVGLLVFASILTFIGSIAECHCHKKQESNDIISQSLSMEKT